MTSGNRPAPEQGSWQVPGSTSAYEPPDEHGDRVDRRGRPGVVALVVALVELAIIAAVGNQAVSKHASQYFLDHSSTFLGRAVGSSLQVSWRVRPRSADNRNGVHILYSQFVTIAVLVVLSALLAAVVARGAVTFWRAFFGVWTGVVAAMCVAQVAGAAVTRPQDRSLDRVTSAFFASIDNLSIFAAAAIGLVTALIAALFAMGTRRSATRPAVAAPPAEPSYEPEAPPPFYGDQYDGRTTQIPRFDPSGGPQWSPPTQAQPMQQQPTYSQPTQAQPVQQQPTYSQPTQAQPVQQQPTYSQPTQDDNQPTQALPRVTDDDQRG